MKLEVKNNNYCATVTELSAFVKLKNCDNVQAALIFGNSVIVGINEQPGSIGLFFPVETQLSKSFLANNNLYRKSEWGNVDPEKKGYFEEHGRIKAVKFRGHKSEGLWIPIQSLNYLNIPLDELKVGMEFDSIDGEEICKKYVPKLNSASVRNGKVGKTPKLEDKIAKGQFHFHIDTANLRKNVYRINPGTYISLSEKLHGTSGCFSNLLINRKLTWYEKLLKRIGVKILEQYYGLVWSSRKVIKGIDGNIKENSNHFYKSDIWGVVAKEIQDKLPKSFTLYGEIVGYTSEGSMIQKGYHYGCPVGSHKFLVYRVTTTNQDGKIIELSWLQMKQFCEKYGLEMVEELFYGKAGDLLPTNGRLSEQQFKEWQNALLKELERLYVHDQMCSMNNNEVPAEGIVLRIDHLEDCESYKLKNFKFLEWETKQLDSGTVDLETQESTEEEISL